VEIIRSGHFAEDCELDQMVHPNISGSVDRRALLSAANTKFTATVLWFTAGSGTDWHSHENGQILYILQGNGFVETVSDGRCRLFAGDLLIAPPGEIHRHGAAPDSGMTQMTLSLGAMTMAGTQPG
jgi:quercetin dioxygenase-like cupin family protein